MTEQHTLSAKWLKNAQHRVNEDPAFRKLGSIDVNMAVKVGKTAYLVTFGGFSCHGAKKIAVKDLRDADFLVEMSAEAWAAFIAGRADGTGRTLAEIDVVDNVVHADNPRDKLDFLRYHTSVQAFFDAGAGQAQAA